MMTYLNLVNNVLRRLREDEVTSVSTNTYSKMVGDFINDAKQLVETAWDWSALRTSVLVTTEKDIVTYSLAGTQDNAKSLDVINDTSDVFMSYQTQHWFNQQYLPNTTVSGSPTFYTYSGIDANGDTQIDMYPKPDGKYNIRFNCVMREQNLENDDDKLRIPSQPVIHTSIALLARERGETGGTSAAEYFAIADKYVSDAIALDAAKHPEETIWYTP